MALVPKPKPEKNSRTVVFVTFESEFAPWGGLGAVMKRLPKEMARLETGECFLVAPFFRNIARCRESLFKEIRNTGLTFSVDFGDTRHEVDVFAHTDSNGFVSFLLYAPDFFQSPCDCGNPPDPATPCNPYFDPQKPDQLLQDALFFCAAVPKLLVQLGKTRDLVLSLQDWQSACTTLTVRQEPGIESCACILTIHNPYDVALSDFDLKKICGEEVWGATVLGKTLWFMDGPLCTVSENFARELQSESLHTHVYVPHLQDLFRARGMVGINNGLFEEPSFPEDALDAAAKGDFAKLAAEKEMRAGELRDALQGYRMKATWGRLDFPGPEVPVFLFIGRDDPRQKGYDLAAAAVRRIRPGAAKYIFTPLPGEEGLEGLRFLRQLAEEERPGEVLVFPYRVEANLYSILRRGSSYLGFCSFYEPFGGATEGYAVGTPVIARATGGLVQQVSPVSCPSLSQSARERARRFHPRGTPPTGFLFREPDLPLEDQIAGWQAIVDCGYRAQRPMTGRVESRSRIRLFDAMVQEAAWALEDAIHLYTDERPKYLRMILNGFRMLELFSWNQTVRDYQRVYHQVCTLA